MLMSSSRADIDRMLRWEQLQGMSVPYQMRNESDMRYLCRVAIWIEEMRR